jgi:hypothetical protein
LSIVGARRWRYFGRVLVDAKARRDAGSLQSGDALDNEGLR